MTVDGCWDGYVNELYFSKLDLYQSYEWKSSYEWNTEIRGKMSLWSFVLLITNHWSSEDKRLDKINIIKRVPKSNSSFEELSTTTTTDEQILTLQFYPLWQELVVYCDVCFWIKPNNKTCSRDIKPQICHILQNWSKLKWINTFYEYFNNHLSLTYDKTCSTRDKKQPNNKL